MIYFHFMDFQISNIKLTYIYKCIYIYIYTHHVLYIAKIQ